MLQNTCLNIWCTKNYWNGPKSHGSPQFLRDVVITDVIFCSQGELVSGSKLEEVWIIHGFHVRPETKSVRKTSCNKSSLLQNN